MLTPLLLLYIACSRLSVRGSENMPGLGGLMVTSPGSPDMEVMEEVRVPDLVLALYRCGTLMEGSDPESGSSVTSEIRSLIIMRITVSQDDDHYNSDVTLVIITFAGKVFSFITGATCSGRIQCNLAR